MMRSFVKKTTCRKTTKIGENFRNGTPIVPGVCYGQCLVLAGDDALRNVKITRRKDVEREKRRFQEAMEAVRVSLAASAKSVKELLSEADDSIFQMYENLLSDPTLQQKIMDFLNERFDLPSALALTAQAFQQELQENFREIEKYQGPQDTYLQERIQDIQDVLLHLMNAVRNPYETTSTHDAATTTPIVLVARELFPSQFLAAPLKRVCGIVCTTGGATSHAAILARALRIPMLVDVPEIHDLVKPADKLLVDCRAGLCFLNPNDLLLKEYQLALNISRRNRQIPQNALQVPVDDLPATQDGTPVKLCGNITLFSELPALHSAGIRDVGLYRTEFMFMIRNNTPEEEIQFGVLKRLVDGADGAEVIIRALDIGGDKPLPYIPWGNELNPSLGWRGLRFLQTNPEIAMPHLRAILRNCLSRNVKLLFPMVSDKGDLMRVKELVRKAQKSLAEEGLEYGTPSIGMMLEVPSAVLTLETLLPEVDFVSIGTNDLIQYLFAVDRGNSRVTQWYQQCHPIVLRLLGKICQTVAKFPGKDLELCGELAGNPSALPALLGAGLRKLSMNPTAIPNIRDLIRKVRLNDCEELYQRICEADTAEQVAEYLEDFADSMR